MLENLFFFVLFRIFGHFRNPKENTPGAHASGVLMYLTKFIVIKKHYSGPPSRDMGHSPSIKT